MYNNIFLIFVGIIIKSFIQYILLLANYEYLNYLFL